MKIWLLSLVLILTSACSTALFVRNPSTRTFTDPMYESSKPYFFLGIVGADQHVFIDQICLGKKVDQMTLEYTTSDFFTSLLTIGIYTPRTLKVWCEL